MKNNILGVIILLLSLSNLTKAQLTDVEDYKIFGSSIKNIKEFIVFYDSTGQATDTILDYEFFFNKDHQVTEMRSDFSRDRKNYISYKYEYPEQGIKIQKYHNPYIIMDGVYIGTPVSKCESFDGNGDLIKTEIVYKNKLITWTFKYESGFLKEKLIYLNGVLIQRHFVEYLNWE